MQRRVANAGGAEVEAETDAAADRVPFGRESNSQDDVVEVAPAFGEAAVPLEPRTAAVPIRQIRRVNVRCRRCRVRPGGRGLAARA